MAISNDIAVVGWSQTPMVRHTDKSEVQLLMSAITDAITPLGLTRADIDFTCLGSCDYITGQAFSFVGNLDAIGAWPPKREPWAKSTPSASDPGTSTSAPITNERPRTVTA